MGEVNNSVLLQSVFQTQPREGVSDVSLHHKNKAGGSIFRLLGLFLSFLLAIAFMAPSAQATDDTGQTVTPVAAPASPLPEEQAPAAAPAPASPTPEEQAPATKPEAVVVPAPTQEPAPATAKESVTPTAPTPEVKADKPAPAVKSVKVAAVAPSGTIIVKSCSAVQVDINNSGGSEFDFDLTQNDDSVDVDSVSAGANYSHQFTGLTLLAGDVIVARDSDSGTAVATTTVADGCASGGGGDDGPVATFADLTLTEQGCAFTIANPTGNPNITFVYANGDRGQATENGEFNLTPGQSVTVDPFTGPTLYATAFVMGTNQNIEYSQQFQIAINCDLDPGLTDVTAEAPTSEDAYGTDDDTYTIPSTECVVYLVDGEPVDAGTYPGSGSVTVTAEAGDGCKLIGDTEWTLEFTDVPAPDPGAGNIVVTAGCGFVKVTNNEDGIMQFMYGSLDNVEPDGTKMIKTGKTVTIKTERSSLDYFAYFDDSGKYNSGTIAVSQDCATPPVDNQNPPNTPTTDNPSKTPTSHPVAKTLTTSPHAGMGGSTSNGGNAPLLAVLAFITCGIALTVRRCSGGAR